MKIINYAIIKTSSKRKQSELFRGERRTITANQIFMKEGIYL